MPNEATVDISWEDNWRFKAADVYGHALTVEAPMNDSDEFDGFKPTHLMLTSLGACTAVDVVSILKKKRQDVTGVDIRVTASQEEDWPKAWTAFHMHYVIAGHDVDSKAVDRAIELSEGKYCSVGATLKGVAKITTSFEVTEDDE